MRRESGKDPVTRMRPNGIRRASSQIEPFQQDCVGCRRQHINPVSVRPIVCVLGQQYNITTVVFKKKPLSLKYNYIWIDLLGLPVFFPRKTGWLGLRNTRSSLFPRESQYSVRCVRPRSPGVARPSRPLPGVERARLPLGGHQLRVCW